MWLRAHERLPGACRFGGHAGSGGLRVVVMGAVDDLGAVIEALDLEPHPEGGWYRRVWTSTTPVAAGDDRSTASSILYLLGEGDRSAWHRLTDAEEVWIHQSGDPVLLHISPDGITEQIVVLGPPTIPDAVPVATVGIGHWQSAERHAPPDLSASDGALSHSGALLSGGPDGREGSGPASTGCIGWSLVSCVVSPEFRFESFEMAPPCWEPGGDQV